MQAQQSFSTSFRRRPESSQLNSPRSGHDLGVVSLREELFYRWILACAGMTVVESAND